MIKNKSTKKIFKLKKGSNLNASPLKTPLNKTLHTKVGPELNGNDVKKKRKTSKKKVKIIKKQFFDVMNSTVKLAENPGNFNRNSSIENIRRYSTEAIKAAECLKNPEDINFKSTLKDPKTVQKASRRSEKTPKRLSEKPKKIEKRKILKKSRNSRSLKKYKQSDVKTSFFFQDSGLQTRRLSNRELETSDYYIGNHYESSFISSSDGSFLSKDQNTEREEWVVPCDFKFKGKNSDFVEEFKEKLLKNSNEAARLKESYNDSDQGYVFDKEGSTNRANIPYLSISGLEGSQFVSDSEDYEKIAEDFCLDKIDFSDSQKLNFDKRKKEDFCEAEKSSSDLDKLTDKTGEEINVNKNAAQFLCGFSGNLAAAELKNKEKEKEIGNSEEQKKRKFPLLDFKNLTQGTRTQLASQDFPFISRNNQLLQQTPKDTPKGTPKLTPKTEKKSPVFSSRDLEKNTAKEPSQKTSVEEIGESFKEKFKNSFKEKFKNSNIFDPKNELKSSPKIVLAGGSVPVQKPNLKNQLRELKFSPKEFKQKSPDFAVKELKKYAGSSQPVEMCIGKNGSLASSFNIPRTSGPYSQASLSSHLPAGDNKTLNEPESQITPKIETLKPAQSKNPQKSLLKTSQNPPKDSPKDPQLEAPSQLLKTISKTPPKQKPTPVKPIPDISNQTETLFPPNPPDPSEKSENQVVPHSSPCKSRPFIEKLQRKTPSPEAKKTFSSKFLEKFEDISSDRSQASKVKSLVKASEQLLNSQRSSITLSQDSLNTSFKDLNFDSFLQDSDQSFLDLVNEDWSVEISSLISSEILNFIQAISFKSSEKEVDTSLEFIVDYLNLMANELKPGEDEALESINTPVFLNPLTKLSSYQSDGLLNKTLNLELILPFNLSNELKLRFEATSFVSRHVYLQMLFDCVNESINYIRPFGTAGLPDPWSSKPRILFGEGDIETVFNKVLCQMARWFTCKLGVLFENGGSSVNLREEKLNELLCVNVKEDEKKWLEFEDEESQVKVVVGNLIFKDLVQETLTIFN